MPSKTSKPRLAPPSRWKSAPACAEPELEGLARELGPLLGPRDRVLLEGELGAGKTTFARALIKALGVVQPPEGSPSFAIAHEYHSPRGSVVHVDLYRIEEESELEDAGISAYYWERDAIVIAEWTSLFPDFERSVMQDARGANIWIVKLAFAPFQADARSVEISVIRQSS